MGPGFPRRPYSITALGGEGGEAGARYIHTTARSWDHTSESREPDDYSTLQDWGRLLALESQVQVRVGWPIVCSRVGHFKEARRVEIKGRTDEGGLENSIKNVPDSLQIQTWTYSVLLLWSQKQPNTDSRNTRESLALKAASAQVFLFFFFLNLGPQMCYLDQPSPSMFYCQRLDVRQEENQVPCGRLQPLFPTLLLNAVRSGTVFMVPSDQWACLTPVPLENMDSFKRWGC